jgi:uncharacterized protein
MRRRSRSTSSCSAPVSIVSTWPVRIRAKCERIVHIEAEADGIHEDGLKKLYQACRKRDDGLIFVTRAEVLDHLEKVVDRFSDVSDEIQGVVIDHV